MHSPNNGPSSSSLPATHFPLELKIKSTEKGEKSPGPKQEQPTVGNTVPSSSIGNKAFTLGASVHVGSTHW